MALPPFQFRLRREEPDWRRLSTVDVDRVAAEMNVAVLQEHLEHVTYCNVGQERCPRCSCPADPLLLKLLRLAQLCLEYLLHSQNYLSAQLRDSQELLRAADAQRDLLANDVAHGAEQIRLLKVECKRRKKMIATQQMMLQAEATSQQCQFCDKAFLNATYLHNHLQRRHSEQPVIGADQTYKLQEEINQLKEQLQVTRSQLEAERRAHMVKVSKEYEDHQSKEEVKEMFMKEVKELTAKNSELQNHLLEIQKSNQHLKSNLGTLKDTLELIDEKHRMAMDHQNAMHHLEKQNVMHQLEKQEVKWASKVQILQEEHEHEKYQLTAQFEKHKASLPKEMNMRNIFYEKRLEELEQKLQEQNDLILIQKNQIEKLASKKTVENSKLSEDFGIEAEDQSVLPTARPKVRPESADQDLYPAPLHIVVQPKSSGSSMHDFGIEAEDHVLPTVRPKVRPESADQDLYPAPLHIVVQPKSSGSSMHDFGIEAEDHVLPTVRPKVRPESADQEIEKQVPQTGKNKSHMINTLMSDPSLTKELRTVLKKTLAEKLESLGIKSGVRGISSDHLNRALASLETAREERKKQLPDIQHIREQLVRQLNFRVAERLSCSRSLSNSHLSLEAKHRTTGLGTSLSSVFSRAIKRSSSTKRLVTQRTLTDENTSTSKTKKKMLKDDISRKPPSTVTPPFSSEEEVEDDDIKQFYISPELSLHKASKSQRKESKEIGGENIGSSSVHICAQGVKFTEDEDDWDLSSLEEEKPSKDEKNKNVPAVEKNDPCAVSMIHECGKPLKDTGHQDADISSSPNSSLVSVTNWSDTSDI
ncbi:cilium assembly protein DZIP1-like isoform X3 [Erythrolamprus reginae]|uniref:cilium assembly protein DZIP1-like isoform X3 n=1 Tax=Erythrolamprus reginae TaxID=121349 RepID=UPI00396C783E